MKQKFSMSWNSSKQVRKQRKFIAKAPLHVKHKLLSTQLSEELRKKHKIKSLPIRKDDEVKIMRGKFKKKTGKVKEVQTKKLRISIEKIQNQKKDGTKIDVWFHPSNLQITALNTDDKTRMPMLTEEKKETKTEKTESKKDKQKSETKTEKTESKKDKQKSETKTQEAAKSSK